MLRPPNDIHRFLFSSPAHFVGTIEAQDYLLVPAFPIFEEGIDVFVIDGPSRRSFVSATLRRDEGPSDGTKAQARSNYNWLADNLCCLLGAYYGKFVVNHGYTNWGELFSVPRLSHDPTVGHALPPFNSKPRPATHLPDLNLAHCNEVLANYLATGLEDDKWATLCNAAAFYQQGLSLFSERPNLSFALLLSCLECLLPLVDYKEEEIFDEQSLADLSLISRTVDGGPEIVKRLRTRFFQIKRRCAAFVRKTLDEQFYKSSECSLDLARLAEKDVERRVKAAYDLRSRFIHTGRSHGSWVNALKNIGAEVMLGDPVIMDAELKKLVVDSVTLTGLERIIQYCLYRSIANRCRKSPEPRTQT